MEIISDSNPSEIIVAQGTLFDRKITKQVKNKNVQKLHKPVCGNTSRIKLCWPEDGKPQESSDLPLSYKKNSEKEKLALWHAENFRLQINATFPNRAPLLLAARNECGVQKLVCSFLRATALPYPDLGDWRGIAGFVADHLALDPLKPPTQLEVQPRSTLRYEVKPRKQFKSNYLISMELQAKKKAQEELERQQERERIRIEEEEREAPDELHGRRVHCWVLVLPGEFRTDVDTPFYLEPASGSPFDISEPSHMGVESVWNHQNYWFNIQEKSCDTSSFDLTDSNSWIPLLNDDKFARNLDMPISWMEKIDIPGEAFQNRYPGGSKTILYKRARLELFAALSRSDGLVSRVTQFSDLEWTDPLREVSVYKHRQDSLQQTEVDVKQQRVVDYYGEGRKDHIREHEYNSNGGEERKILFYNYIHPEGLASLHIQRSCVVEEYKGHSDWLQQRVMRFKMQEENQQIVELTVEDLLENPEEPASKNVAQRKFFHLENKIFLKFHHAPDQISAGYLHFIKPTAEEGKFGVEHIHEYEPSNISQDQESDVKSLIEEQIEAEKKVLNHAEIIYFKIKNLLNNLQTDRENPGLQTSVFDEERNQDLVHMMQLKEQEQLEQAMRELVDPVDPLAPLLERKGNLKYVTPAELSSLKQECEEDIKNAEAKLRQNIEEEIAKLQSEVDEIQQQNIDKSEEKKEKRKLILKIQALQYRLQRLSMKGV